MRLLVSGTTRTVARLAKHHPDRLGMMLTPANRNSVESVVSVGLPWVIDNGAFSGFDPARFRSLLRRAAGRPGLLWVACPDAVGDAKRTIGLWRLWLPELTAGGFPAAFVLQDGQENLPLPDAACYFIGGSTRFKLSNAAASLALEGKTRGATIHMGRVNSRRRIQVAHDLRCDSIDGSSASMYGDKYIHKYLRWMEEFDGQPVLFA